MLMPKGYPMLKTQWRRKATLFSRLAFPCCLLAAAGAQPVWAGSLKNAAPIEIVTYGAVVPLGNEAFVLQPLNKPVYLFACVHSPELAGLKVIEKSGKKFLLNRAGDLVRKLPSNVIFRITASTRSKLVDVIPFPIKSDRSLNSFLLALKFKIKVFRGLDSREITPSHVKLIGLPDDVPYEERIFNVAVHLEDISPQDHVVLEVWTPDEKERLTKFHMDLM